MNRVLLRQLAPYALLLVLAGVMFWLANGIDFTARTGQLGPDVWPKLAAGLIAAVCIYELVRLLITRSESTRGIAESLDAEADASEGAPEYPKLLFAGVALTAAYGALVPFLGFLLASFLYLVAFMYVGRYRSHGVIWSASAVGTLLFALIFLKVVYVSLPRGVPPFDSISDFVLNVF